MEICPAGIVTVAGTVAEVVSLLLRVTVKAALVGPVRVTVPVAAPAPAVSANAVLSIWSVSVFARSMLFTVRVAVPGLYPGTEAVMVTLLAAVSTMPSSTALMANVAEVWPAGIVTVEVASVAWAVLLLVRLTVKADVGAAGTVTMPVAAFVPSSSEIVDRLSSTVRVGAVGATVSCVAGELRLGTSAVWLVGDVPPLSVTSHRLALGNLDGGDRVETIRQCRRTIGRNGDARIGTGTVAWPIGLPSARISTTLPLVTPVTWNWRVLLPDELFKLVTWLLAPVGGR